MKVLYLLNNFSSSGIIFSSTTGKGTVSVISSDPPSIDGNARFTTVPTHKASTDHCVLKVASSQAKIDENIS